MKHKKTHQHDYRFTLEYVCCSSIIILKRLKADLVGVLEVFNGKGNGTFPPNMFDTSVKVPTLISQPGHVPEGEAISSLHSHYDLMPTLLDYLAVGNPDAAKLPGRSFVRLLHGDRFIPQGSIVVFDEYGPTRMIRSASWKYVHRYPFGPHELYDLVNDPDEQNNLADQPAVQPAVQPVQKELYAELESWFVHYTDPQRDATHEAVMGRGQLDVVGPAAKGKKRFEDDVVYHADFLDCAP